MAEPSVRRAAWRSPAKVNLCLRIVGRRDDGYHLLDSIFVAVDLYDRITLAVDQMGVGGETRVEVRCDHADVPATEDNLAARAARLLLAECGRSARVRIDIEKVIPPGAGLGGGSGNAATVLAGMNALLGLGVAPPRLTALALALGADVPFFLVGGAARVRGIGEHVQPIAGWPELWLVAAVPPFAVATAWAFRAFAAAARPGGGDEPARLAAAPAVDPALLVNDLERVVVAGFPALARLRRQLVEAGAGGVVMSGSGSTMLGLASSTAEAARIAAAVRIGSPEVRTFIVRPARQPTRGS